MSGLLLDTSFLITLVNPDRDHHETAKSYYREALQRGVPMYLSTIVVAEFQVGQDASTLPLHNFIVVPFNYDHGVMAGALMRHLRDGARDGLRDAPGQRGAMKDDVKLLAQAACTAIPFVLTADEQTLSRYAHRMTDAGHTQVQAIVLSAGFDPSWFQDGQGSLLGH